jgi:nucleotide-binding universal stress UspA family protein
MVQSAIVRWSNPRVVLVATNLLEGNSLMFHAISQAKLSRAKVLLVHVVPPSNSEANVRNGMPVVAPRHQVRNVLSKLNEMVEEFQRESIQCEPVVLSGFPGQQIPLLVKSRSVDRVIIANRNLNGVSRLVEGSVSEELITGLEVPVCIIGRRARPGEARGTPLRRILFATSFEPSSALFAELASTIAELNDSQLTLLHVLDSAGMSEQHKELARFAAQRRLLSLIPVGARHRQQPVCLVQEGDPATIIASKSCSMAQDLLILGSPYPSMLSWLLGNSVVHRVIVEAQCPVLTIRPRGPVDDSLGATIAEVPIDHYEYA